MSQADVETSPAATPTGAVAVGSAKPPLPEGVIAPIAALNWLKTHKPSEDAEPYAPADFQPQRMYGFIKNPGKTDPFPFAHYDANGEAHAEPQVANGVTITRPGVKLQEVLDWWLRAGERQEAKAAAKAAKAEEKAKKDAAKAAKAAGGTGEVTVATTATVAAEEEGETENEPEEGFEDVEAE